MRAVAGLLQYGQFLIQYGHFFGRIWPYSRIWPSISIYGQVCWTLRPNAAQESRDHRCDALAHLRCHVRIRERRPAVVGVGVDESRRDEQPRSVVLSRAGIAHVGGCSSGALGWRRLLYGRLASMAFDDEVLDNRTGEVTVHPYMKLNAAKSLLRAPRVPPPAFRLDHQGAGRAGGRPNVFAAEDATVTLAWARTWWRRCATGLTTIATAVNEGAVIDFALATTDAQVAAYCKAQGGRAAHVGKRSVVQAPAARP